MRHRCDEPDTSHALRRDGRNSKRVRAARRPADDGEPLHLHSGQHLFGVRAERAPGVDRAATFDREQPHTELTRDRVVGMTRQPGIAAAVQVDDGCPVRIADVVDRQRVTIN